jgi:hypothetical protein
VCDARVYAGECALTVMCIDVVESLSDCGVRVQRYGVHGVCYCVCGYMCMVYVCTYAFVVRETHSPPLTDTPYGRIQQGLENLQLHPIHHSLSVIMSD